MREIYRFVTLHGPSARPRGGARSRGETPREAVGRRRRLRDVDEVHRDVSLLERLRAHIETRADVAVTARHLGETVTVIRRDHREPVALATAEQLGAEPLHLEDVSEQFDDRELRRVSELGVGIDFSSFTAGPALTMIDAAVAMLETECYAAAGEQGPAAYTQVSGHHGTLMGYGLAKLMKVTSRTAGYVASRLAATENILPGEDRTHELTDERMREVETTFATTVTDSETTTRSQTTSEQLATESSRSAERSWAVQGGITTSAKYGTVQVDATLEGTVAQTTTNDSSTATSFAREVTEEASRTLTRETSESWRALTRQTLRSVAQKKLNRSDQSAGYTGMYFALEEVLELEVRQWGTRLMLEFMVRDPAELLHQAANLPDDEPPELNLPAHSIHACNYLALAKKFGATDLVPPPPLTQSVSWSWTSDPDEDSDDYEQSLATATIDVPAGYMPEKYTLGVAGHNASDTPDWFVNIAGTSVLNSKVVGPTVVTHQVDPRRFPSGVDLALRVFNHRDTTAAAVVRLDCTRSPELYRAWQIATWEALMQGQRRLRAEFERAKAESAALVEDAPPVPEPARLRTAERAELRMWCIGALRALTGAGEGAPASEAAVRFYERSLEWEQMTYTLHGAEWASSDELRAANRAARHADPGHEEFLRAGAATVFIPVTPTFEDRIVHFLDTTGTPESELVTWMPPKSPVVETADLAELWTTLVTARDADLVRGSGRLEVERGSDLARVASAFAGTGWIVSAEDVDREIIIEGAPHVITSAVDSTSFLLDRPYDGDSSTEATYLIGSRSIGAPWRVTVPTSLMALREGLDALGARPDWLPGAAD